MSARQAYYTNESFGGVKGGFHIARVIEGERGYYRSMVPWSTLEEAQAEVDRRNAELELSRDEVLKIVFSSMAAQGL